MTTTPDSPSRSNRAQGAEPEGGGAEDDESSGRPFVIEFAGTPRAGKTTALHGLRPRLERLGYHVGVVEERARLCPVPRKRHPDFNLWTANATVAEILAARYAGYDVLLVDRGPFDALTWMDSFRRFGLLRDDAHESIHRYLAGPIVSRLIDLVLVMTVDPFEALLREGAGSLHRTPGPIINPDTLHTLNSAIESVTARSRREFQLEPIDTTLTDASQTLEGIADCVGARLRIPVCASRPLEVRD